MLVSPFAFYRGGALLMASDLAGTPRSGLTAQICGDAHLSNFGVFASPERRLVFDINDFDETLPGPWEWDVKRLAASIAVAGRENGFRESDRRIVVLAAVAGYREAMREFAAMRNVDVWYAHVDIDQLFGQLQKQVAARQVKRARAALAKARTRDSMQAFAKLTRMVDGEPRIVADPPLIVPVADLVDASVPREQLVQTMRELIRSYRGSLQNDRRVLLESYRFVDMARKVVGVGSVGTRAWIVLLMGIDGRDPLFLQAKEAQPSVLERFVGKSRYSNQGSASSAASGSCRRSATSSSAGSATATDTLDDASRDFYIRQLRDWKGSAVIEEMVPRGMAEYARVCGWTLARAHARSGDRVAIASYLGGGGVFDQALAEFAERYADQNERDYRALQEAVDAGRLEAVAA